MAIALLADAAADGGLALAGWSTFGLAGLILTWLFLKHLPAKDAQMESLLAAKDTQLDKLITSRDALLREQLGLERESCEKRHMENVAMWREDREVRDQRHESVLAEHRQSHADSKELRHAVRDLAQTVSLWTELVRQTLPLKMPAGRTEGGAKAGAEGKTP